MDKVESGAEGPGAQIHQLLTDLRAKRDEINGKLDFDYNLKEELQRQLLQLTEDLEECDIRMIAGKKQKKKFDMNVEETEQAIQKLDETSKKLGETFSKLQKKK